MGRGVLFVVLAALAAHVLSRQFDRAADLLVRC